MYPQDIQQGLIDLAEDIFSHFGYEHQRHKGWYYGSLSTFDEACYWLNFFGKIEQHPTEEYLWRRVKSYEN